MLPRTVLLLFLCVSVGMCATLGHYQARAEAEAEAAAEAEGAALREAAAADLDPTTEEGVQADVQVDDSPADNSLPDDNILAETPAMEDPKPEADVPEADSAAAEVKETKSDDPVVASPAADEHTGEEVTKELPLVEEALTHEKPAIDEAVTQANLPEEPAAQEELPVVATEQEELPVVAAEQEELPVVAAEQEKLSEEALEQDKLSEEAVKQEEPLVKEEEDNEIKPIPTKQALSTPSGYEESSSWGLNSIRNSFQTMHGYFDSLVELVGGHNGVCQYRCRYGETPQPRPGYQLPEPNGCSSFLVGYQLDLGVPAMRNCCDELDMCYDTCGVSKYDCDAKFRTCLHSICTDVNKSLGFVSKVEACESMADTLFNTVWTLGCRPYMNSQRAACICAGEERDEL